MEEKNLDIRNKILNKTKEHFFKYGYTKTNLDEVTQELSMSKKTLYKYFVNKKSLLESVVADVMNEAETTIASVFNKKNSSFLEKQKEIIHFLGLFISKIRIFIQDIQKNEPEIWTRINEFRKRKFFDKFRTVFTQAQESGYMRKDVDQDLAMNILFGMIENMTNFKNMTEIPTSMKNVIDSTFKIFFEGMMIRK